MFTGLIQDVGQVRSIDKDGDWRIVIETGMDMTVHEIGASIACSGCCLTVVEKGEDWFAVDVSHESLSKTVIGTWNEGTQINLEPSLKGWRSWLRSRRIMIVGGYLFGCLPIFKGMLRARDRLRWMGFR